MLPWRSKSRLMFQVFVDGKGCCPSCGGMGLCVQIYDKE